MITMLTTLYNYIFGYTVVNCKKCNREMRLQTKHYHSDMNYYCSNSCGYYKDYD